MGGEKEGSKEEGEKSSMRREGATIIKGTRQDFFSGSRQAVAPLLRVAATAKNLMRAPPWLLAWAAMTRSLTTIAAIDHAATEWKPLYRRLSALGGSPEGSVAAALEQWLAEGRKVTVPQLMKHIRQLRKYGRPSHAIEVTRSPVPEIMGWMEKQDMEVSNGCFAVRLDLIFIVKGVDSAEHYFSTLPDSAKNHKTFGALLNCYCSSKMDDKAITLFKKMKELNFASNVLIYNNLMSLHLKLGQREMVPNLFQEMKACYVIPNYCSFRILMRSYALDNDIASVERAVQELEGIQGAADWSTYCHLAAIYTSAGLFVKARTALMKAELVMDSHDLSPFPFLINLYAKAGHLVDVRRIWKMLRSRIAWPTNRIFLAMLKALKKFDDMDSLKHCFEEWESGCLNYDTRLVHVVIEAYLQKDMMEEARLLLEKASPKCTPADLHLHGLVINHCLKRHDKEPAQKYSRIATRMVKLGKMLTVEKDDAHCEDLKYVTIEEI